MARVTDKEFVVKMKNENAGEVAYPLSEVSRRVRVEANYLKQVVEAKPDGQYPRLMALTHLKPADIKPGTVVKMSLGFASLSEGGQKLEEGHYYQAEIQKLPD